MAKFEYEFIVLGPKKTMIVYKDGNKIYTSAHSSDTSDNNMKDEAVKSMKDTYSDIASMSLKKPENSLFQLTFTNHNPCFDFAFCI